MELLRDRCGPHHMVLHGAPGRHGASKHCVCATQMWRDRVLAALRPVLTSRLAGWVPFPLLDPICHATLNTGIPFVGPIPDLTDNADVTLRVCKVPIRAQGYTRTEISRVRLTGSRTTKGMTGSRPTKGMPACGIHRDGGETVSRMVP
eukprot:366223-Chlamydomonas_euryale.AAC.17